MSKYFEKAKELVRTEPLPEDIEEQLDHLFDLVDVDEQDRFAYLYEFISLQVDLLNEDE
jgi:hypothetical protein